VKLYREGGTAAFFAPPKKRSASKLSPSVCQEVQALLDQGLEVPEVGRGMGILPNTLHKAIRTGRLRRVKKKIHPPRRPGTRFFPALLNRLGMTSLQGDSGKARDDATKFGNGGSEKDKALGIKVTMSEARLLIGAERQAQSAGFKPRVESDQRPFSHLIKK
jgi:hypothetical protein